MPEESPSDDEFDFSVIDGITNSLPDLTQDPADFDLSAVDKLLPKNKRKQKITPQNPQPMASATSGGKVRSGYGVRIPPTKGASNFHKGIDIVASAGTPINPADEGEVVFVGSIKGKGLSVRVKHLDGRETEYNHLSKTLVEVGDRVKREAVLGNVGQTGVATGPHLDFRVIDENGTYVNPFTELANDPRQDGLALELSRKFNPDDFDFTAVDEVAKSSEQKSDQTIQATDPDKIEFKAGTKKVPAMLHWLTSNNKPKIVGANPLEVGDIVKTKLDWWGDPDVISLRKRSTKPDINTITDTWLRAWNPEYEQLNKKFRQETGGLNLALVDDPKNSVYLGKGQYEIQARTSRGVKALFEAYKKDGLAGYNATNKLINEQISNLADKYQEDKKFLNEQIASRPYLEAAKSGIEHEAAAITHLATNVSYLGRALITGNVKGYDSQEYLDLIEQERAEQDIIAGMEENIYRPPSFAGKLVAGTVGGIAALPRFAVAGRVLGLPTMVYLENLHRGNREAALAALPMALMAGSMHGANQFIGSGGGTSAPFRFTSQQKNISIDQPLWMYTLGQTSGKTIKNLTPLERQLLLRGSNALLAGTSLATDPHQSLQDFTANLIVGLGFPVGRSPKFKPIISPELISVKRVNQPLLLEPARIDLPLTEIKPAIGQTKENPPNYLPSGEVGLNKYGEGFEANIETGFVATTDPQTVRLDLDTAAMNLLDLRRALRDQTYKVEGDSLETVLLKQQAIQNAISHLEKAIPPEALEFFEKNETLIREALRGNLSNRATRENLAESQKPIGPNEVEPARINKPVFSDGRLREDIGKNNVLGTNREKAENIMNNFFNITNKKQGTFQASLIPYGDVIARKISDLGYLAAFFMEDYYHRGIEPRIDVIANRLRDAVGDLSKHLTEEHIKEAFRLGASYLNSNVADPFFSRMKQDATEKLPNRFTAEQARNILSQHKDEFAWTVGLDEFLDSKDKFTKQELVDIIQRGQIVVDASIAEERNEKRIEEINIRLGQISNERFGLPASEYKYAQDLANESKALIREQNELMQQHTPRYSLEAYSGEKLELPGAKNSKEVKLISPPEMQNEAGVTFRQLQDMAMAMFEEENADYIKQYGNPPIESLYQRNYARAAEFYGLKDTILPEDVALEDYDKPVKSTTIPLYKSAHWDEGNIVAHYRANDRITTDNQRLYFGEEFQSDWAHDIREKGIKLTTWEATKLQEEKQQLISENNRLVDAKDYGERIYEIGDRVQQIDELLRGNIEPNPFMGHNWKELVLKRFLRDAAIAKDENGNYKYDGIGWTTARQQLERYGGTLEGKDFTWKKNVDGTYSFSFKQQGGEFNDLWTTPHELDKISLERFAELTTKEAADFVRNQEATFRPAPSHLFEGDLQNTDINSRPNGKFSLSETVELRSKEGTYADYDIAYKNIVSKIGKRFGAKYSKKEIETSENYNIFDGENRLVQTVSSADEAHKIVYNEDARYEKGENKKEKIHYLEITPSMRQSLEREGMPTFGLGRSEPVKSLEVGIRNRVTTREAFDSHRNELVKAIEDFSRSDDSSGTTGNVFNSGLNPDALIDQFKLLYRGIKDFQDFSSRVVDRFGEEINPFLHDLWIQVQEISNVVSSSFNDLADYLQNGKNSPIFKARHINEGGFLGIGTKASQAFKDYKQNKRREGIFRIIPPKWHRGISLAQNDTDFGEIYNVMRSGQRARNAFESGVLNALKSANDYTKDSDPHQVAEIIFQGNEQQKVFSTAELSTLGLSPDQIEAYREIRRAEDLNLEWRKQHTLYNMRERADQLNDRLMAATPGTPAYDGIVAQLLDLGQIMTDVNNHYEHLKQSGYISLQRQGKIVALANDSSGLLYQHFDSVQDANKWVLDQESAGATGAKIYDFRLPEDLRSASARLTPGQFEDLVDQAGVNPNSPEIELMRDEVYSRYPSYSYQLKRDFTRGYDRNWKFVLDSVARQTEIYANSFYARVAGNEGLKKLSQLDLYNTNPEIYEIARKFIDDEISSPDRSSGAAIGGGIRKAVYLINLGFDLNQLYLNAVAQPITQTYSYFARVEHGGVRLGRAAAEKYFAEAGAMVNNLFANKLAEKVGSNARLDVDPLFESIYTRLQAEKVIEPEFNKSLLEMESQKSVQNQLSKKIDVLNWQKFEHWASVFMRAGEKTTRAHAAAEAFLVGTKKFNLAGEQLVDFMVRAVDATQSNPSRGEAPFYIRKFGETGKLFYQFNAFNHMWLENLALNVRSDFQNREISATARHLAPLVIMGGIKGLPLTGFAFGLYTLITGDDLKKEYFDKWFKDHETLERLALYGVTTVPSISQKITPSVPVLDTFRVEDTVKDTVLTNFESSMIPALSTTGQILQGFDDLVSKNQTLRGAAGVSPRALRGPLTVARTSGAIIDEELVEGEGYKTRGGKTILPKGQITTVDKTMQFFNIAPIKVSEYHEKQKVKKLQKIHKQIKKRLGL